MSIPSELDYDAFKPNSVAVRIHRQQVSSEQGNSTITQTSTSSQEISFRIPKQANCFLDQNKTYIVANIKCTAADGDNNQLYLNRGSTSSLINRLIVEDNGSVLEQIEDYDVVASLVEDWAVPENSIAYKNNALMQSSSTPKLGEALPDAADASTINGMQIIIPLSHSSVLGTSADKMVPVYCCDLKLRIFLNSGNDALYAGDNIARNYILDNVYLYTTYVEIDANVVRDFEKASGGEYVFNTVSRRIYNNSLSANANATTSTLTIPAQFESLLSLETRLYNTTYAANNQGSRLGADYGGVSQYYYVVQGQSYPQNRCAVSTTNYAEAYMLAAECHAHVMDINYSPAINSTMFIADLGNGTTVTDAERQGSFTMSADVSEFDSNMLLTGIDTRGADSFLHVSKAGEAGIVYSVRTMATFENMFIKRIGDQARMKET